MFQVKSPLTCKMSGRSHYQVVCFCVSKNPKSVIVHSSPAFLNNEWLERLNRLMGWLDSMLQNLWGHRSGGEQATHLKADIKSLQPSTKWANRPSSHQKKQLGEINHVRTPLKSGRNNPSYPPISGHLWGPHVTPFITSRTRGPQTVLFMVHLEVWRQTQIVTWWKARDQQENHMALSKSFKILDAMQCP